MQRILFRNIVAFAGVYYGMGNSNKSLCSDRTWFCQSNQAFVLKSLQDPLFNRSVLCRVMTSKTMLSRQKQIIPVKKLDQLKFHHCFEDLAKNRKVGNRPVAGSEVRVTLLIDRYSSGLF